MITLRMEAYLGARETDDEVRPEGSPTLRVRAIGGYQGDIATASILVNSLPKVLGAPPESAHDADPADPIVLPRRGGLSLFTRGRAGLCDQRVDAERR